MHRFSPKQRLNSLSIRQKLFLLRIGIGLIMGIVIGAASVWVATLVLYGFAADDLKTTGRLISGQVGQALLGAGDHLVDMAESKEMEKFFHTDREVVLASLMKRYAKDFDHMVYFDYEGRARVEAVRGRVMETPDEHGLHGGFLQAVKAPNSLVIVGVVFDRALDAPSVWFYYNHVDYFNNPMGVVAASISLDSLSDYFEERFSASAGPSLLVTDGKGRVVFSPGREGLGAPAPATLSEAGTAPAPGREYLGRREVYGHTAIVTSHSVPDLGWKTYSIKPASKIYRSLYLLFGLVFLVTVTTVAGGEMISRFLGIRIVEPIERLIRVISDILESGNLTQRVEWASRDEMGTLAGLFNAMLAKIDTEQIELKERRTRELEQEVARRKKDQARLRQAIADAEAATRAKSEFLANMSHEIRTPMNGIIGMAELALDSNLDRNQEELISIISSEAESLMTVINTILDFSKIEAGKLELESVPFNLRELFEDLAAAFAVTAGKKGLNFTASMPPQIPEHLVGDPGRLRQILVNLTGNAIKFTPRGEVRLSIEEARPIPEGVNLRFSIEDTGIGIPEERRDIIFDSFVQADGSTTREYGGTGLGTTISKQLVEMMGGAIGFESREQGGTRFWFTVVCQRGYARTEREKNQVALTSDAPVSGRILPTGEADTPDRKIRILLVEDYPANQEVAQRHLTGDGYRVETVENGAQAVDIFGREPFDLVLMDIQMPVMDGYEATKRIREIEGDAARVPIIALTAHAVTGYREKCLGAGMDDYLTKPLMRRELLCMVAKWTTGEQVDKTPDASLVPGPEIDAGGAPVDMAKAMDEFQNDSLFFKKVLKVFMDSSTDRLIRLEQAVYNRDFKTARQQAHTVKGGAGNVAAMPLFAAAFSLEASCETEDTDRVAQSLEGVKREFQRLKEFSSTLDG